MRIEFFYGILKYFLLFVMLYILHSATIQGLQPFAFGMFFALVWCNQKIYYLAPLYVLSGFLASFDLTNLVVDTVCVLVFGLAYLLHYRFKRRLNPVLIGCYAFLSQAGMFYYAVMNTELLWGAFVTLVIGMVAMYAYLHFMQGLVLRGLRRQFLIDEVLTAGVLIFALGVGVSCVPFGEYIFSGVITFGSLFLSHTFSNSAVLMILLAFGLGSAFSAEQFLLVSQSVIIGLTAVATKCSKRAYACVAVVLVDIIIGLYFMPTYTLYNLLAILIGALLFLLMPSKMLTGVISYIITEKEDTAVRSIVNRSRKVLCSRLYELSDIFFDMKNVFKGMVKGARNFEEIAEYLATEIKQKMCIDCANKNECLRIQSSETHRAILEMLYFAYERGRVSLLDVPPNLCAHCVKLNALITAVNNVVDEYKNGLQNQNNLDSGRLLLGEQMWGVSQIMKSLAVEVSLNVSFDNSLERRIMEDLMYEGIVCSEAVVYRRQDKLYSATIVVKKKNLDTNCLVRVLSKSLGFPMEITNRACGVKAGFEVITLDSANRYDLVFGSAGAIKADSSKSGDTHSVMRLGKDKILFALCDGMGSGEQAERTSSLALGLIENFYRAGFDNSLILSSVNKLLSLSGEETFSALDASVINLNDGTCDMIKLGSPVTYIKSGETLERLEAGALPLGILEELKPNIRSCVLNDGDMIILLTDGISDSFRTLDDLDEVITQTNTTNPQILANAIIDKALELNKNIPNDDMTVMVGRIFTKF